MTGLLLLPRLVRHKDAPGYVGVDRNRFDAEWRPFLTEVPLGPRSRAFDRHELDALRDQIDARKDRVRNTTPNGPKVKTRLYRHFNAEGHLLYVGISFNAIARLGAHLHGSGWSDEIVRVEIETLPSRYEAERAERLAIRREGPRYNVMYARRRR